MSVILHHTVSRNDVVFSIVYSICKVRLYLFKNPFDGILRDHHFDKIKPMNSFQGCGEEVFRVLHRISTTRDLLYISQLC